MTLDIPRACQVAFGAVKKIAVHRGELAKLHGTAGFDIACVDRLETIALGTWYAYLLALPASAAESPVMALIEEAAPLCERMLASATMFATVGIFSEARRRDSVWNGYTDAANDFLQLSRLHREKWAEVQAKSVVTEADLERAVQLGSAIGLALGARAQPEGESLNVATREEAR